MLEVMEKQIEADVDRWRPLKIEEAAGDCPISPGEWTAARAEQLMAGRADQEDAGADR